MIRTLGSIFSLLLGVAVMLLGIGLLSTLLGVRAGVELFPQTVTGVIMSCYFVGYVIGTFLCPAIIRRVGHVRAFSAMAALASVTAIAHALVVNPWAWGALRVMTGMCVVGLYMVIESWLNVLTTSSMRGRVFSTYIAVSLLAMAGGQYLLLVGEVRTFVPFAIASMLLSLALVPIALTRVLQPTPVETPAVSLFHLHRVSPLGSTAALVAGLTGGAFWGMGAVFAQRVGLDGVGIAAFMSVTILGGALLQWPVGHYSDNRDRRTVLMVVCFLAALAALVGYGLTRVSPWGLVADGFFYGGLSFSVYGLAVAHMNDHVDPTQVLEVTRGLLLLYGLGAAVGPASAGVLMAYLGPGSLMAFLALAFVLLGGFAVVRMRTRAPPVPAEEQGEYVPMLRTSPVALEMDPRAEVEPELDLGGPGPGPG
ncbi:MAG: MFS transporter [Gammaproteobacteria bacterium]